ASEHPGVHVLAAHPMQGMARSAGLPQDLVRDDFLHARRVHLARASATGTPLPHAPPAGPPGLRHAAHELAVATAQIERVHLDVRSSHTQQGPVSTWRSSRTARPRTWFVYPWPIFPKRRPRHASQSVRSPNLDGSTERAADRTSSTGPQRGGGLKFHASRNKLTRRFAKTIAVISTYCRSRSRTKDTRLRKTRTTGVKMRMRTPRLK